ncbi:DEAD/DEAH box helicase [Streptomyces sp. NPDC001848]|uniref:DEAD/DEAH box helicase n=1 Tax=Streptomyces sp. NPDC001848 TaxID=3364618 RepID=UPI0036C87C0C
MRPTLAAEQVRASLSQYLATTYALADESTRRALQEFLGDPDDGIFRGPYLRIRTPFRTAVDEGWRQHLEWYPEGFRPHRHQALAWQRLSTLHGAAEPTLVTTGTGSGKTESFLIPVLDHCLRARTAGQDGVKALLLYPMNALATDQAQRINDRIDTDPRLKAAGVRAGLYIGDTPSRTFKESSPGIAVDRDEIRRTRPDILITNYKMLDLLLQRPEDRQLWQGGSLAYVVLDEFHTYDGAQGTDVAMLLRRLGAVTGLAEDGRPLGPVCPVATSATLGESGTAGGTMLEVAEQVFGVPFPPEAVVGESRRSVEEFVAETDFSLPFPAPHQVAGLGDPTRDQQALDRLIAEFTGRSGLSPAELGDRLRRHRLTAIVLEILDGRPRTYAEIMEFLPRLAPHWGMAVQQHPQIAAQALARYVALLSMARNPDDPGQPLLSIEVHHWVRSVSRVLRGITPARAEFRWDDERITAKGRLAREQIEEPSDSASGSVPEEAAPLPADDSAPRPAEVFLPAVFCRECGRSGWAALSPETDAADLDLNASKIRQASVGRDRRRVRNMIAAFETEAYEVAFVKEKPRSGATVMVLDGDGGRLRPLSPESDFEPPQDGTGPRAAKTLQNAAFVWVDLAGDRAAETDQCPFCRTFNAIRYLGTGLAALAAASITQLFTGKELDESIGENKTLLFNDSVQDAAHRAGYVASRSYTFSFRSLLASRIEEDDWITLSDLAADIVGEVVDSKKVQVAVVPPDLHVFRGVDTLLAGRSRGSRATWGLIAERLAFAAVLEFGLRSRQGRTLELTRTVATDVPLADPDGVADIVRELLHTTPGDIALPDGSVPGPDEFVGYVRGLLERLRTRGAIRHAWLDPWLAEAGVRRWQITGGRTPGMPAFPRGVSAPAFLLGSPKKGSDDFDVLTGRLGWYQDWTMRALGLRNRDAANDFLVRLLPALTEADVLSARTAKDGSTRIYGLQPGHVRVRKLADDVVTEAGVHCDRCSWQRTVHPDLVDHWHGQACPRYQCGGHLRSGDGTLRRRDFTDDFYRRMYREAGVFTINTAEHTSTLDRRKREAVEQAFREGTEAHYANPQVLSCTPTLELGIDIGDLSAVVLASLPKGPANYVQRVGRAGRTTGNAYLLTMVDRGPRDRYYLEDPKQMIAGEIQPPGCYLSAVEILRRQYLAHLLDVVAAKELLSADSDRVPVSPMPRRADELFDDSGWLTEFQQAALADAERLVKRFLALFPPYDEKRGTGLSPEAAAAVEEFAAKGLRDALDRARQQWNLRRSDLQHRSDAIIKAMDELVAGDPEHDRQRRELRAELRAVGRSGREISSSTAHSALVDLGLLPNYSLVDSTTELEATLLWKEEENGETRHKSKVLRYDRTARFALTDFAPGNHYYVQGYKHRITGLDIGSPKRPAWLWWRICPDCGYVRTHQAEQDPSACPRCASPAIGDVGCLHKVLVPHRVHARDQRDDARVRDDTDERERRHYTVVPAVDIPRDKVVEAYKHRDKNVTFGWEFTREAVIRHINVGALRVDGGTEDAFAGRRVRLNPFWVCDSCGYADPDGGPSQDDALIPAKAATYHRPWCPRVRAGLDTRSQRQGVRLLLAHELRTEALRILIPAVTAHTQERLVSFKAALLAGIARSYGGDPDHLEVVTDSMPDRESGDPDVRRHFLVLYDTLPGGTGYLHRLAGGDGLREVLALARETIETCVCRDEGRRACHRCLLRHVEDSEYELASREQALDILGELFGPDGGRWGAERVATTQDITLVPQMESELEALFRRGLLEWAGRDDVAEASVRTAVTADGRRSTELRLTAPDGTVTRWQMETQVDCGFTRPDVVFTRLDEDQPHVAVYLDGYRHHASPERNRVALDAARRTRLRALGRQVFQLTWDDVQVWTGRRKPPADPVWTPYQNTAQRTALDIHRRLHSGDTRDLPRLVWANPVDTLIGYLTRPDAELWRHRAQSALAGFAAVAATSRALADGSAIGERIGEALRGQRLAGGKGAVQVMATRDASGCPLTIVLDLRRGQAGAVWSAATVLDDGPEAMADEAAHRRRWQAWLYWTNLLQFLNEGNGDGMQLVTSTLSGFDVAELAVTGGAGWLSSQRRAAAEENEGEAGSVAEARPVTVGAAEPGTPRDPGWSEVIAYLVTGEPGLAELAGALADRGVPVPEAGYELGAAAWTAELAWPARRVAVVLAHRPPVGETKDIEAERRDQAYAEAGWQFRTALEWDAEELAALLLDGRDRNEDEEQDA